LICFIFAKQTFLINSSKKTAMKPKKVILVLFLFLTAGVFAQNNQKTIVCSDILLQQITTVKSLGDNVNAAYQKNLAAPTLSRSGAIAVKKSLDDSYEAYLAELQNQLKTNSADSALHTSLLNEIVLVKKLMLESASAGK
jgi:hypothetical protein